MNIVPNTRFDIVIRMKKDLFIFRTKKGEWCKQTSNDRRICYKSLQSLLDKNVTLKKELKLLGLLYANN